MVILVTGKAGAGKSTHAFALAQELRDDGIRVRVLDGDLYRRSTGNQDYSDQGRESNLMGLAQAAARSEDSGAVAIVAAIAPRKEWRQAMRAMWKESRLVYLPGGCLWDGTTYERPSDDEF